MTIEATPKGPRIRLKQIQSYVQPGAVVPVCTEVEGKREGFNLTVIEKGPDGVRLAKSVDEPTSWAYYASWKSLKRGRMGLLRFNLESVIGT